jgi:hypothetical protein
MSYTVVVLFLFLAECDICDGLTNLVKVSHCMSSSSSVPTGITLCKVNEQLIIYVHKKKNKRGPRKGDSQFRNVCRRISDCWFGRVDEQLVERVVGTEVAFPMFRMLTPIRVKPVGYNTRDLFTESAWAPGSMRVQHHKYAPAWSQ